MSRLISDLQPPVEVYCLPALNLFVRSGAPAVALLWPSQTLRREAQALCDQLAFHSPARAVVRNGGDCCFEYLGIPFAVFSADESQWRFPLKEDATLQDGEEARRVARGEYRRLREARRPHGRCRRDPLYQHYAERWLESLIVQDLKRLDPDLRAAPVYTQVPAYLTRRRVIDLVAVTEAGRLVVIEVKAQRALELLFQGLAYWRIVWQAQQENGFQRNGYFTGVALSKDPPLLYCVTPLLLLHPEARGLAACLQPEVEAVLIGINSDWRAGLKVLQRERLNGLIH